MLYGLDAPGSVQMHVNNRRNCWSCQKLEKSSEFQCRLSFFFEYYNDSATGFSRRVQARV